MDHLVDVHVIYQGYITCTQLFIYLCRVNQYDYRRLVVERVILLFFLIDLVLLLFVFFCFVLRLFVARARLRPSECRLVLLPPLGGGNQSSFSPPALSSFSFSSFFSNIMLGFFIRSIWRSSRCFLLLLLVSDVMCGGSLARNVCTPDEGALFFRVLDLGLINNFVAVVADIYIIYKEKYNNIRLGCISCI